MPLDKDTQKLVEIYTHRSHYCDNRLPCGIASAPEIFQLRMKALLKDVPGTHIFLDDVLISKRETNFGNNRHEVLQSLQVIGVRLREDRCEIGKSRGDVRWTSY